MAQELDRVRTIRNAFAHATTPISFETPEIAAEMRKFLMLNAMDGVKRDDPEFHIESPRDKRGYLLVVHIICIMLDDAHRKDGGGPLLATHEEEPSPTEEFSPQHPRGSKRPGRTRPTSRPPPAPPKE
jgi:hypothetical protein